jgi:enoyl-CoA hydratase/carnithine racemase
MNDAVLFDVQDDGTARVLLNRPRAANAVDPSIVAGMQSAVARCEDDPAVRVVVLGSTSPTVFCAGADLRMLAGGRVRELFPADGGFAGFVVAARTKPWIAMVDGAAIAGGMELALACDLIVCSPNARFALPEVSRGLAALAGGAQRLVGRIPAAAALDMILTGEPVDGVRAWQLGLASRVFPSTDLLDRTLDLARRIAAHAPGAVRDSLRVARHAIDHGAAAAWRLTPEVDAIRLASPEFAEGVRAFLEKREPRWPSPADGATQTS